MIETNKNYRIIIEKTKKARKTGKNLIHTIFARKHCLVKKQLTAKRYNIYKFILR